MLWTRSCLVLKVLVMTMDDDDDLDFCQYWSVSLVLWTGGGRRSISSSIISMIRTWLLFFPTSYHHSHPRYFHQIPPLLTSILPLLLPQQVSRAKRGTLDYYVPLEGPTTTTASIVIIIIPLSPPPLLPSSCHYYYYYYYYYYH